MSIEIPLRYELKYIVPEGRVEAIRAAISPYCVLDSNSAKSADRQYLLRSVYLDTPSRALYRASRAGLRERFKVRVRDYGSGTTFLEVKHKRDGLVRKTRAMVPSSEFPARLASMPADLPPAEKSFRAAVDGHALEPVMLMHYEREAYFSTVDTYARVTFDRRMRCQPAQGWDFDGDPKAWIALDHAGSMKLVREGVLVELKCTTDVPRWMARLVERLELSKCGFSKYCLGVERLWGAAALPTLLARTTGA